MSEKGKVVCQVCGTTLNGGSEACPVCALRGVLGNESAITESRVEPTHSPFQLRLEHYEILTHEDGTPTELGRGAITFAPVYIYTIRPENSQRRRMEALTEGVTSQADVRRLFDRPTIQKRVRGYEVWFYDPGLQSI